MSETTPKQTHPRRIQKKPLWDPAESYVNSLNQARVERGEAIRELGQRSWRNRLSPMKKRRNLLGAGLVLGTIGLFAYQASKRESYGNDS